MTERAGLLSEMLKYNCLIVIGILFFTLSTLGIARPLDEAPMNIQAALLVKLLGFNESVNQGGDLVVYVVAAPKFGKTMKPAIGRSIGASKLADVVILETVPNVAPSGPAVLYVGQLEQVEPCLKYCREHQILSITGAPGIMDKGVALRIGVEQKKPAVLLSTTLSKKEGVQWNSQVFSIASDE